MIALSGAVLEASLDIDEIKEDIDTDRKSNSQNYSKKETTEPSSVQPGPVSTTLQLQPPHPDPPHPAHESEHEHESEQHEDLVGKGQQSNEAEAEQEAMLELQLQLQLQLLVVQEDNVQRALQMETTALHARGTFIPSLRFELDDDSDANLLKKIENKQIQQN